MPLCAWAKFAGLYRAGRLGNATQNWFREYSEHLQMVTYDHKFGKSSFTVMFRDYIFESRRQFMDISSCQNASVLTRMGSLVPILSKGSPDPFRFKQISTNQGVFRLTLRNYSGADWLPLHGLNCAR